MIPMTNVVHRYSSSSFDSFDACYKMSQHMTYSSLILSVARFVSDLTVMYKATEIEGKSNAKLKSSKYLEMLYKTPFTVFNGCGEKQFNSLQLVPIIFHQLIHCYYKPIKENLHKCERKLIPFSIVLTGCGHLRKMLKCQH